MTYSLGKTCAWKDYAKFLSCANVHGMCTSCELAVKSFKCSFLLKTLKLFWNGAEDQ